MVTDDLQPLLPLRLRRLESRIPRFKWDEDHSGDRHPSQRRVSLYSKDVNQTTFTLLADDRQSPDFLTVFDGALLLMRTYTVLWIPPKSASGSTSYYFNVQTGDGTGSRTLCSEPFTLASLKPDVPVSHAQQCPTKR